MRHLSRGKQCGKPTWITEVPALVSVQRKQKKEMKGRGTASSRRRWRLSHTLPSLLPPSPPSLRKKAVGYFYFIYLFILPRGGTGRLTPMLSSTITCPFFFPLTVSFHSSVSFCQRGIHTASTSFTHVPCLPDSCPAPLTAV